MDNNGKVREISSGEQVVVLQLTFCPATFRLEIGGNCVNCDIALAAMEQARRYYEGELRKAAALRMNQELQEIARNNAIAQSMRKH